MAGLILGRDQWQQMEDHVRRCSPEEACGIVAGLEYCARQIYPVTNKLHSPVRFRMEEIEQLAAMEAIEQNDWEILAIYHSHPKGPSYPSPTDLTEFAYPGSLYLIWSHLAGKWECQAYALETDPYQPVDIHLEG